LTIIAVVKVRTGNILTNSLNLRHIFTPLHGRAVSMFLAAAMTMK